MKPHAHESASSSCHRSTPPAMVQSSTTIGTSGSMDASSRPVPPAQKARKPAHPPPSQYPAFAALEDLVVLISLSPERLQLCHPTCGMGPVISPKILSGGPSHFFDTLLPGGGRGRPQRQTRSKLAAFFLGTSCTY